MRGGKGGVVADEKWRVVAEILEKVMQKREIYGLGGEDDTQWQGACVMSSQALHHG